MRTDSGGRLLCQIWFVGSSCPLSQVGIPTLTEEAGGGGGIIEPGETGWHPPGRLHTYFLTVKSFLALSSGFSFTTPIFKTVIKCINGDG